MTLEQYEQALQLQTEYKKVKITIVQLDQKGQFDILGYTISIGSNFYTLVMNHLESEKLRIETEFSEL